QGTTPNTGSRIVGRLGRQRVLGHMLAPVRRVGEPTLAAEIHGHAHSRINGSRSHPAGGTGRAVNAQRPSRADELVTGTRSRCAATGAERRVVAQGRNVVMAPA